ncbi:MAG: hypothetical protein WCF44_15010, partial [Candidatus Methylophosphatis roskildensis]
GSLEAQHFQSLRRPCGFATGLLHFCDVIRRRLSPERGTSVPRPGAWCSPSSLKENIHAGLAFCAIILQLA